MTVKYDLSGKVYCDEGVKNMKRNKVIVLLASLCTLILVIVLLALNVSFGMSTGAYAAASIAFDKQAMQSVDRIVIRTKDAEYKIADVALVKDIVSETSAATHMNFSCPCDKWIDMYCGERLLRSMGWSSCCDAVNVYDTDAMHWVISMEGIEEGGSVYLSADLVAALNACVTE